MENKLYTFKAWDYQTLLHFSSQVLNTIWELKAMFKPGYILSRETDYILYRLTGPFK